MAEIKLGAIESRFADIIWDNEPLSSNQLTKLAQKELNERHDGLLARLDKRVLLLEAELKQMKGQN